MSRSTSFEAEGFLQHTRGREFAVQGHGRENTSGMLAIRVVTDRDASDEIVELGNKQGLKLHAAFDDAHPDLVMLEAIGLLNHVEHLAKGLGTLGYHRLPERP